MRASTKKYTRVEIIPEMISLVSSWLISNPCFLLLLGCSQTHTHTLTTFFTNESEMRVSPHKSNFHKWALKTHTNQMPNPKWQVLFLINEIPNYKFRFFGYYNNTCKMRCDSHLMRGVLIEALVIFFRHTFYYLLKSFRPLYSVTLPFYFLFPLSAN